MAEEMRIGAFEHAACPICFEDLASKPQEVGALLHQGCRVEATLYHSSCVGAECGSGDSRPQHLDGLSPVTRKPVDGFRPMPALSEELHWCQFVDWNNDKSIDCGELAHVVAAMLPLDQNKVEDFVRDTFDTDSDGRISDHELQLLVLPYLREHLPGLQAAMPSAPPPEICPGSQGDEFSAWFRHWDADGSGQLDNRELSFALAKCFYKSLGPELDVGTKDMIVSTFLTEADINGDGQVSEAEFLSRLAPMIKANLPTTAAY